MLKATLKNLAARKLRMGLTALAVVLAVGFIAGTYVLTDTMNSTFENLFSDTTAGTDLYVRSPSSFQADVSSSRKPIDAGLLEPVQATEGVAVAAGTLQGYAQLVDRQGEAVTPGGPPTLGFNWGPEPLNPLELRRGRPPMGDDDVLIDAATAERYGFDVGDRVEVLSVAGAREFTVSGVAGFGDADNIAGATVAVFNTPTAQELFDKEDEFDSIDVAVADGASKEEVRRRLEQALPEDLEVATDTDVTREQTETLQRALGFFNTALLVFAGISLFVGAFIIYNTFSITVAQRTHDFGLLRALGASGGQVMTSVILEALIVGLIGSALGIGVGLLIAAGLHALLQAFGIDLPSSGLELQPRTVVVSLVVGTAVTVASAILPARKAARVSPMEALRETAPQPAAFSRARIAAGALITLLGAATLMAGLLGDVAEPVAVVGAGALVVFLGVAFLAPLFAGLLARVVGAPAARINLAGKLAQKNAERNPRRTAATASALMIGLALVGLVGIFAASLKASTNKVVDESLEADFTISPTAVTQLPTISPQVAQEISRQDEISAVAPVRLGQFRNPEERTLYIVGTDPAAFEQTANIEVTSGQLSMLGPGEVFVYGPAAEDLDLQVGEELRAEFPATGADELTVAGLFDNKALLSADYLVSLETFDEHFPDAVDSSVLVRAGEGVQASEARGALEEVVGAYPNVQVQDQTETKEQTAGQVDQLLGLVTALLALALLIALLGITNTLALSVFERTRELGLLRAVGMARRQARAMIRWESVIIAVIGALLGIAIGIFFGWAVVTSLEAEGITELAIPGGQLLGYVVAAGIAGVIAAIPPARRAARLNVLEAIATE